MLWARSYMILDEPTGIRGESWSCYNYSGEAFSSEGEIDCMWWYTGFVHGEQVTNYWHGFGFKNDFYCLMIDVPHWFLALITGVLPLLAIRGIAHNGQSTGSCTVCGYDLRATPDRCPECGTVARGKTRTLVDSRAAR